MPLNYPARGNCVSASKDGNLFTVFDFSFCFFFPLTSYVIYKSPFCNQGKFVTFVHILICGAIVSFAVISLAICLEDGSFTLEEMLGL